MLYLKHYLDTNQKLDPTPVWTLQLEDEIQTLRQVLACKVRDASELKKKLGITPMVEFKQDLRQGFQNIKDSDAYVYIYIIHLPLLYEGGPRKA